jgi:tyrosine decarboxylase / aspartate 1-decarboxylase
MWVLRNYFQRKYYAKPQEIAVVYSQDAHYSMPKGANLLGIRSVILDVNHKDRKINLDDLYRKVLQARRSGVRFFIVVLNMGTTMFGSVDDIQEVEDCLRELDVDYYFHVDAAFGGFIYPFVDHDSRLTFEHPKIISFSIDAHKMLQAPYGTGIFLVRKNFIDNVCTADAKYVKGKDFTLVGSRSGANAISVWMIMRLHGSSGWYNKIHKLIENTDWLCAELDKRNIRYFRNPYMNIVAIHDGQFSRDLARKYHLVPDTHEHQPAWWKIVVMDHVNQGTLAMFIDDLNQEFCLQ